MSEKKSGKKNKESIVNRKLEDFCRNHDLSLELINKITNKQELMDIILDEYIYRLNEIPGADISKILKENQDSEMRVKLKSLIMFASQAVVLRDQADLYHELEKKSNELACRNQQLQVSNDNLHNLNKHYLNMLSFVSHELRSPLVSILGYAELLEDEILGEFNKEQKEAISVILRVSKSLLGMIKNYLDLSKIETGQFRLKKEKWNLVEDIINPVTLDMREQFAKKCIKLVYKNQNGKNGKDCKYTIYADKEMIRIVFINIFSNAVKYGDERTNIEYSILEDKKHFIVKIKNFGDGLTKDKLEKIFKKFTQFYDSSTGFQQHGAGLGLFITKNIIEHHSGSINAESKAGEWFKVIVTLLKSK